MMAVSLRNSYGASFSSTVLLSLLLINFILMGVKSVPVSYSYSIDPSRYAFAPESARKWLFPDSLPSTNSGRYSRQLASSTLNITIESATTSTAPPTTTTTLSTTTTETSASSGNEPLDTLRGCYHQGRFVHERSLIQPKDSCMNCTCANGVVQCQLTLCTLYRNIPDGCQLARHESQCCPALECVNGSNADGNNNAVSSAEVATAAATSASATANSPPILSAEDVIKQKQVQFQIPAGNDTTECKKNGFVYQNGDFVPSPDPCEACYCLRETVRCVTQLCELPEDTRQGCLPVYMDGICCPVRYQCGKSEPQSSNSAAVMSLLSNSTTTQPSTTTVSTTEMTTTTTTTTTTTKKPELASLADQRFELPRSDATFFHMDELKPMQRDTTNNITVIEISTHPISAAAANQTNNTQSAVSINITNFVSESTTTTTSMPTTATAAAEISKEEENSAVMVSDNEIEKPPLKTVFIGHHETDPDLVDYALIEQDEPSSSSTTSSPTSTKQLNDDVERPLERPAATTLISTNITISSEFTTTTSTEAYSSSTTPSIALLVVETPKAKALQILLEQKEKEPDVEFDEPAALEQLESAIQEKALDAATLAAIFNQTRAIFEQAGHNRTLYQIPLAGTNITVTNDTMEMMEMVMNATTTEASTTTERNDTGYRVPIAGADILAMLENMTTTEAPENETMSTTTELATTTERNDTAYRVPIAGADILEMLMNMTGEGETNETMPNVTTQATTPSTTTVSTTPGIKMIIPLRSVELPDFEPADVVINERLEQPPTLAPTTLSALDTTEYTTATVADEDNLISYHTSTTTAAPEILDASSTTLLLTTNATTNTQNLTLAQPNTYLLEISPPDLHRQEDAQHKSLNQKIEQNLNDKLSLLSGVDGSAAVKVETRDVTMNNTQLPANGSSVSASVAPAVTNLVLVKVNLSAEASTKPLQIVEITTTPAPMSSSAAESTATTEEVVTSAITTTTRTTTTTAAPTTTTESDFYIDINNKIHYRRPPISTTTTAPVTETTTVHHTLDDAIATALSTNTTTTAPTNENATNMVVIEVNLSAVADATATPIQIVEITTTSVPTTTSAEPSTTTTEEVETPAITTTTSTEATTTTTESDFYMDINNQIHYRRPPVTSTSTTTAATESTTVHQALNNATALALSTNTTIVPMNVTVIALPENNVPISNQLLSNVTAVSALPSNNASSSTVAILLPPTNQSSILLLKVSGNETVVSERIVHPIQLPELETTTQIASDDDVVVPLRPNDENRAAPALVLELATITTEPTTESQTDLTTTEQTSFSTFTTTESPRERALALLAAEKTKEPDVEFDEPAALEQLESAIQEKALDAAALAAIFNQTRAIFEQAGHNRTLYQIPLAGTNITVTNDTMEMMEMVMNATTTEASTTTERNDTGYRVPIAGSDILAMLENMTTTEAPENETMSTTTELATTTERNDTAYRVPIAGADILEMLMNMTGEGETNETMSSVTTQATTPSTTTVSTTPGIKMIIPLRMGEINLTLNSSNAALQNITVGMLQQTAIQSVAEVINNATATTIANVSTSAAAANQTMNTIAEQAGVQIVGLPATTASVTEATVTTTTTTQPTTEPATSTTSTSVQTTEITSTTITTTEPTTTTTTTTTTEPSTTTPTTTTAEETTPTTTTRHKTLVAAGVPSTTLRPETTTLLAPLTIEAVRGRQRGSLTRIVSLEPIQDGQRVTIKSQINLGDKTAIGGCMLDNQTYSNYQAIPLAELRDPCIVRICKDGVIYGPSMQRCPPAIDGCLPTQVVGVCCPVYLCPTIIEQKDNSTTLTRPLGSAASLFVMNEASAAELSRNYVCRINSKFLTLNERVVRVVQDKCQTCECKHNGIVCEPGCGKNQLISSPDLIGELALGLSVNLDTNQHSIRADTPPPLPAEQQLTTAASVQQPAANALLADQAGGIAGQRGCQIKERYYKHGENIDFGDECHTCACYDSLVNCRINKDKCNALVRRRRRFDFMSNLLLVQPIDFAKK